MSGSAERIGRDYRIDYGDVVDALLGHEEVLIEGLTAEDKQRGGDANLTGFIDNAVDQWKGIHEPLIEFNRIFYLQRTANTQGASKRFGILFLHQSKTAYDFVNSSGEVLIPRGTEVAEMIMPRVRFPQNRKEAITPGTLTRSFGLAAYDLSWGKWSVDIDFIIGLTHPRMGNLAANRWGFSVETKPFPPEVYQLIDQGLKNEETDPENAQNLALLRKQVLVYQTREEFVKRALSQKDLGTTSKDEVLELARITARITERRIQRWDETGVSLRLSAPIDQNCSDEQALKDSNAVAVVTQGYQKGEAGVDGKIVPFKTKPEVVYTTYKNSPGVRVIPVSEVPQRGGWEAGYAIVISSPDPKALPVIKFLSPRDRVVDPQSGHQIYP